jgi:hypothetical protein
VKDQVNLEVGQNKIIQKLLKSQDYTIDLNEEDLINTITEVVKVKNKREAGGTKLNPADLTFETRHHITNTLDSIKTSQARFGNGYFLTQNRAKAVSVGNRCLPLVYPVQKEHRNIYNAFYPTTYQNRGHGQYLCDEVKAYCHTKGLSSSEAAHLYKALEPLFYLVQEELHQMVTGLGHHRWVSEKNYSELLQSLQSQTGHHFYMVKNIHVKGLDQEQAKTAFLENLLGKGLSFLPNPHQYIHLNSEGMKYYLGQNKQGRLSLIYPYADFLPYPVLKDYRTEEQSNIPAHFVITPAIKKQWHRTGEFVEHHSAFRESDKPSIKLVLSALGTQFHNHLKHFQVRKEGFPVGDAYKAFTEGVADEFAGNRRVPEPYLTAFYGGGSIIPDFTSVIQQLYRKGNAHFYLTEDLWPSYLTKDQKTDILQNGVRYLMFKDILDRAAEFEAHHPIDVREIALKR